MLNIKNKKKEKKKKKMEKTLKLLDKIKLKEWKEHQKKWISEKDELKRRRQALIILERETFKNRTNARLKAEKMSTIKIAREKKEYNESYKNVYKKRRAEENKASKQAFQLHQEKTSYRRLRDEQREIRQLLSKSGLVHNISLNSLISLSTLSKTKKKKSP